MLNIWSRKKRLDKECLIVAPYANSLYGLIAEEIFESLPNAFHQPGTKEKIYVNTTFFFSAQTVPAFETPHNLRRLLTKHSYDLIFAVGMHAAMAIKYIYAQHRLTTPVVFAGVTDPVSQGLAHSLASSSTHFTGIAANLDTYYDEHIGFLSSLASSLIKQVIIVTSSDRRPHAAHELTQIRAAFKRVAINILKEIVLDDSPESLESLAHAAPAADLVFMPRHLKLVGSTKRIADICNQYDVPLYAANIDSVEKGALFAYTVQEQLTGREVALKAIPLLYDLQTPGQMLIDAIKRHDSFVIINENNIERQGGKIKEILHAFLALHHNPLAQPHILRYTGNIE